MVITNSRFTENAVSLALANDVLLIDRERLIKLIELKYEKCKKLIVENTGANYVKCLVD